MNRRGFAFSLFYTAMVATAGCSGSGDDLPRESVSGAVTLDGEPLSHGMIQFRPSNLGSGSESSVGGGSTVEAGRFAISRESGLTPGSYKVAINASADKGEARTKGRVIQKSGLAKELIPSKYNSKTELAVVVKKGGTSDLKFDLQSK